MVHTLLHTIRPVRFKKSETVPLGTHSQEYFHHRSRRNQTNGPIPQNQFANETHEENHILAEEREGHFPIQKSMLLESDIVQQIEI